MRPERRRRRSRKAYRLLLRLYPAAHRRMFGPQMLQTFGDHYRDVVEEHGGSRLRFWLSVLADLVVSVARERVAAVAARWRRPFGRRWRRSAAERRWHRPAGRMSRRRGTAVAPERPRRVRRRLRYRSGGRRRLIGRSGIAALIAVVALVVPGLVTGRFLDGALLAGVVLAGGLARILWVARRVPAGGPGDGPAPPGGASVREPRRPLPQSPAGSRARPDPDADGCGQSVAVI